MSQLPSSVVIIDKGKVIARGPVRELLEAHAVPVVELVFNDTPPELQRPDVERVDERRLRLPAPDPAAALMDVLPQLPEGSLASVEIVRPDLESVYLALTGQRYDEADSEGARAGQDGSTDGRPRAEVDGDVTPD